MRIYRFESVSAKKSNLDFGAIRARSQQVGTEADGFSAVYCPSI
jgi:hypothetical protein